MVVFKQRPGAPPHPTESRSGKVSLERDSPWLIAKDREEAERKFWEHMQAHQYRRKVPVEQRIRVLRVRRERGTRFTFYVTYREKR